MSEPRLISPMLDNFDMGEAISERNGVRCCPAMEKDSENKYIVKIISCPATQSMLDALILSGAYPDVQSATAYFKSLADEIVNEAQVLQKLSQLEGFLPYDNWQLVPMENESGYDVYLLSKYRRTLAQHLRKSAMTHLDAINLGLDLCASLAVCRRLGYIYADLKPENIYLNSDNAYRIGDIGFMRLDSLKYASLQERYRSAYTAPELTDPFASLNTTIDIYALGLILYQVFNGGQLPVIDASAATPLQAPDYADYEMSEIILKACAADPESRWQDPVEMGQAIVSYMQRNGAHDTPIIPVAPTAEDPELPADEATFNAADVIEDNNDAASIQTTDDALVECETVISSPDDADDGIQLNSSEGTDADVETDEIATIEAIVSGVDDQDETLPENTIENVDYNEVSDEVSDILNQADDLLSHPTPDPVVAPEPVEVVLPNVASEEESADSCSPTATETTEMAEDGTENLDVSADFVEETYEVQDDNVSDELEDTADIASEAEDAETSDDDHQSVSIQVERRTQKSTNWLAYAVVGLVLAFLALVGYLFYTLYYLQPIESFTVQDNQNGNITVLVGSQIPDEKLYVVCTDIYGNQIKGDISNGKTQFTGLKPDSPYTLNLEINGFHRLTGETELTVSTPPLTDIVQFLAVTGSEDGSVVLSVTVEGPDAEQWKLSYAAAGESAQTVSFTGHIYTITGLTLGNEYTFTLTPEGIEEFTGVNVVTHTASKVVKPVDLQITGCMDNKLSVAWSAPVDTIVESWTVRCFNESGFESTQTVTETTAVFDGVDSATSYTVEVTAAGMSVSERATAEANSITAYDIQFESNDANELSVSWNSTSIPNGGWVLQYTVDGSPEQKITITEGCQAVISAPVPGATYAFTLIASDETPILGSRFTFTTEAATKFSNYGVTASDMTFSMCKTPKAKNWDRFDLSKSDYTSTFPTGTKASFLVKLNHKYKVSNDKITTLYVIRDDSGNIVSHNSTTAAWKNMWLKNYCELDIPSMPTDAGKYSITVFFNGAQAYQRNFTITQ